MAQQFTFVVTIETEHLAGKFVSRDAIAYELALALDAARDDVSLWGIGPDRDSDYEATSWRVAAAEPVPAS